MQKNHFLLLTKFKNTSSAQLWHFSRRVHGLTPARCTARPRCPRWPPRRRRQCRSRSRTRGCWEGRPGPSGAGPPAGQEKKKDLKKTE